MKRVKQRRLTGLCVAFLAVLALAACDGAEPTGPGPRAWIDAPPDGETLDPGTIIVISHSSNYILMPGSSDTLLANRGGITEISLYASGALVRTDLNPNPDYQGLVQMEQPWVPPAPGEYVLVVRAKNRDGMTNASLPVRVRVGATIPTPTPTRAPTRTPTPVPGVVTFTPTPVPGVVTFTPTPVPGVVTLTPTPLTPAPLPTTLTPTPPTLTPTRTLTPPPPPACSGTPNIASFSASPSSITAGGSSTLSWGAVTNADSVYLGSDGVAAPGSRVVAPATSTTYTLTARCGSNTQTRQVTVFVTTPTPSSPTPTRTPTTPPPQPPAAPSGLYITNKVCTSSVSSPTWSLVLHWTDNAKNEAGYRVYLDGKDVAEPPAGTTSQVLKVSNDGKIHTFGVEAFNSAGVSTRVTISDACVS